MFIKNTKNYYAAQWAVLESIELLLSVLRIGILSLKRFVADYNFLSYWAISTPSFGKIHFHLKIEETILIRQPWCILRYTTARWNL